MDNLEELQTAWNLPKAPISAWALHELHQKRLKSLRKWLLSELQYFNGECITINVEGAESVSNEDVVGILLMLVNERRRQEHKEPLSIEY